MALAEREGFDSGFFQLKPDQPNYGFKFDWNSLPGHMYPPLSKPNTRLKTSVAEQIPKRLLLATHLAQYLRLALLDKQGFTCSAGISISKVTAKLAGTINKPCAQTVLLTDHIQSFLDKLEILSIPGIGGKTGRIMKQLLRDKVPDPEVKKEENEGAAAEEGSDNKDSPPRENEDPESNQTDGFMAAYYGGPDVKMTVLEARTMWTRQRLDAALGNMPPGSGRVWELLHGIDNTEVAKATLVPTQISIEDTFK